MNTRTLSGLALVAALGLSASAFAQVPSGGGGSDAKGNAPLKHAHTVNDGGARRGHTSFTEAQARRHIVHAGYTSVTGLTKGDDGVWRGTATKNGGGIVNVGMDFKGNVSEARPVEPSAMSTSSTTTEQGATASEAAPAAAMSTETSTRTMAATDTARTAHHRHHHRHHHVVARCATPGPNGAACSGVDKNRNGVSDKEDRAIKAGAHP